MTSRPLYILFALLFVSLLAAPAWADDTSSVERAQGYFDTGAQFYFQGEYGRAIVEFRKAHQAHPHPIFLYNIALSSTQLGRFDQAYEAAIQVEAMEESLPPEQQARNRGIIHGVEVARAARQVSTALGQVAAQQQVEAPPVVAKEPQAPPESGRLSPLGWAGVGSLAVGALSLGGAAFYDLQVQNGYEELQALATGSSEQEFLDQQELLQGQQTTGQILLFSGIGLATVGAGLLVFDLLSAGSGDQNLSMSVSPGSQSVTLRLRW